MSYSFRDLNGEIKFGLLHDVRQSPEKLIEI